MRDAWARDITERARAHWTPERLAQLARGKMLLLPPVEAAPLLRAMSLLARDGSMPPDRVRKYLQINHMVAVLGPSLRELRATRPTVRLIDAACGRSYLSLLLAWCFRELWKHPVEVLGIDRNEALVERCRHDAALALLDDVVRHEASPLAAIDARAAWARAFGTSEAIDGVLALHACDTATDDAILLAVSLDAPLCAVAPCCHAELARGWSELAGVEAGAFSVVHGAPHLRREAAATTTDAMRTLLLRAEGYEVWPLEFVPSEHTPKNTLIRAMRRGAGDPGARAAYDALVAATGGRGLALADRLAAIRS
ncbi:MAG: SAM-dependent methyltransferase [Sandaracinus sp.]